MAVPISSCCRWLSSRICSRSCLNSTVVQLSSLSCTGRVLRSANRVPLRCPRAYYYVKPKEKKGPSMKGWVMFGAGCVGVATGAVIYLGWPEHGSDNSKDPYKNDVIVTSSSTSTVIKENNRMLRTTPAHITEQLGHFLNSNTANSWKILAGKLGYDATYKQSFGVTPTEATQRLLQDWQQKSGSTVFVLYTHLKEMGRDDAASKLLPYLGEQACETQAENV